MSYYYKNYSFDIYKINDVLSNQEINKGLIEIYNNEDFTIDMSELIFYGKQSLITNSEIFLILIDWGDGKTDKLAKKIIKKEDKIKSFIHHEWKIITHKFNKTDYNDSIIEIKIYNTAGDLCCIKIPYKIINKSLYEINTDFKLLASNKSNNNLTQFVMKEGMKDSIIIVSEKNWKELK